MKWRRYAAAAVFGAALVASFCLLFNYPARQSAAQVATPNTHSAYLTLYDGPMVALDSPSNSMLARNALNYMGDDYGDNGGLLNIIVPKGSDVVYLQLADGTKVWLNAGSSIQYPVVFNEQERKVAVTGEAYFEVAGSNAAPFIVRKDEVTITALGAKFNVNGYTNEGDLKVTVLEGRVEVAIGPAYTSPSLGFGEQSKASAGEGEQASVSQASPARTTARSGGSLIILRTVDAEQVVAWKEEKLVFNNTNIQMIMRQLERWYDLDPTLYENDSATIWNFNGEISRDNNAAKVLQLLEQTGAVKFAIDGKKIIVTQ